MTKLLGMFIALCVLCAVIAISNSNFLGPSNLTNTARQVALLGIYAVGVSFVIIAGGIDLSIGSVISLAAVLVVKLSADPEQRGLGLPLAAGVGIALLVSVGIGLLQGLLITRAGLQPFILTLAGMLLYRGAAQTVLEGGDISFGSPQDPALRFLVEGIGEGRVLGVPSPAIIFLGVLFLSAFLLHFTVFGRYVYAVGGNREAARYSGVPVRSVEMAAYTISAALAGLAGILYAAYLPTVNHQIGFGYELTAIAAAVLGGCSLRGGEGSVLGVVIGAAIMQVMDNGINMFQIRLASGRTWRLDENWKFLIVGGVILGAVALDAAVHRLRARRQS